MSGGVSPIIPVSLSCWYVDVDVLLSSYIGESVLYHARLGVFSGLDLVDPFPVSFGIVV